MKNNFDLLTTIESGGCTAKIPAGVLRDIVSEIPIVESKNLIVGSDKSDDALVYKISDETAIIQTTDFFPPICSDPYEFGQIAAANALSDIFAMGGKAITALNIVMFPYWNMDISILQDILKGGAEKCIEAGAVLAGGHTINDDIPKYGLAVTGTVHPDKIITNDGAKPGDDIIITKALGTAVIMAAKKADKHTPKTYKTAIDSMKQLNMKAARVMQKYEINCATDVTGFGLLGHLLEIAKASNVEAQIFTNELPVLPGTIDFLKQDIIPGASFRNLKHVSEDVVFDENIDEILKMITVDAQTSGGLLICSSSDKSNDIVSSLKEEGYYSASIIGKVAEKQDSGKFIKVN